MKQKVLLSMTAGFLLGVLWLVAFRFFTYQSANVHHHANFALYVNGQQEKFDNFTFYEEVQSCGSDAVNEPRTRVHLHDNVASVAHVHDNAATWGHLFANWGYTLGDSVLKTDEGTYLDGTDGNSLTFWLNGEEVGNIANRTIASEDRLLINYGTENSTTLEERYNSIPDDAHDYNERNDPAGCAGTSQATVWERLKIAIGFSN